MLSLFFLSLIFKFKNKSVVMKSVTLSSIIFSVCFFWGTAVSASIIQPGMMDDFENGTTNSWVRGQKADSSLAPKNIANSDESNRFLQVSSHGGRGPGSSMVFFNEKQWAGDYSDISSISLTMKAESTTEQFLYIRLAIFDSAVSGTYSRYVSSESQLLTADGDWHTINLSLAADDLTRFRGEQTADSVLSNVSHLRILSHEDNGTGWNVDKISATLAIDNIMAISSLNTSLAPVPLPAAFYFMLAALFSLGSWSRKRH